MFVFGSIMACTFDLRGIIVMAILPRNYAARSSGDIPPPPPIYIC
jgi:hypothetical protein